AKGWPTWGTKPGHSAAGFSEKISVPQGRSGVWTHRFGQATFLDPATCPAPVQDVSPQRFQRWSRRISAVGRRQTAARCLLLGAATSCSCSSTDAFLACGFFASLDGAAASFFHPREPTMKFRFPILIIDEDFRSENASGLGIRALAAAIEGEGAEVVGATSYGDLSQFAQQQSRASAFILSIDDEEFSTGGEDSPAIAKLRDFIQEIRFRNSEIPIFLYGETRTSSHIPNDILRELHGFIHMFEDTPEFVARHILREARSYTA